MQIQILNKFEITTKWAGVFMTGKQLTAEQTLDVVAKCDPMFSANRIGLGFGNNHQFIHGIRSKMGLNQIFCSSLEDQYNECFMFNDRETFSVDLTSSSWIGGPNSWLLRDGSIFKHSNIGKYVTTEDVIRYWTNLSQLFPFLDLTMTVFDCELTFPFFNICNHVEDNFEEAMIHDDQMEYLLFNLRVFNGQVEIMPPDLSVHEKQMPEREQLVKLYTSNPNIDECFLDDEQLKTLVLRTKKQVDSFLKSQENLIEITIQTDRDAHQQISEILAHCFVDFDANLWYRLEELVSSIKNNENMSHFKDHLRWLRQNELSAITVNELKFDDNVIEFLKKPYMADCAADQKEFSLHFGNSVDVVVLFRRV